MQFASTCATLPLGMVVMQMSTAEPNQSYTTQSGQVIHCDGLLHTRGPNHAICSRYGTIHSNPQVFIYSSVALAIAAGLLGIASLPGRGFAVPQRKSKP